MRKPLFALIVVVAMAVPAGISLATSSFHQTATVAVTDHHAGAARVGTSVGLSVKFVATDAAAPGGKPKAAKQVVMTFPRGTSFNLSNSVSRVCTLSDAQLKKPFAHNSLHPPTCPSASEVGHGSALLNTNPMGVSLTTIAPPLVATVRADVHVYVHSGRQLVVVLRLNSHDLPGASQVILHAHASSHTLTVDVPRLVYGKSKKPYFGGVPATIVSLKLTVAPTGSGSHSLIRAGQCDRGRFVVNSRFTYFDHSRLTVGSASKCSR